MRDMGNEERIRFSQQPQLRKILPEDLRIKRQQPIRLHQRVRADQKIGQDPPGAFSCGLPASSSVTGKAKPCLGPDCFFQLVIDHNAGRSQERADIACSNIWMSVQFGKCKWRN